MVITKSIDNSEFSINTIELTACLYHISNLATIRSLKHNSLHMLVLNMLGLCMPYSIANAMVNPVGCRTSSGQVKSSIVANKYSTLAWIAT